jgi:hypothetical protein
MSSFMYSANTVLIPLMASRLMLSLKKASMESVRAWSLSTMSSGRQALSADRTIRFASQVPGGSHNVVATSASTNFVEEGVELESVPQLSLNEEELSSSYQNGSRFL